MILPTKDTPPGTPCWVRDNDNENWEERNFLRAEKYGPFYWVTQNEEGITPSCPLWAQRVQQQEKQT